METVKMLYVTDHLSDRIRIKDKITETSERTGLKINLDLCEDFYDMYDFYRKIITKPYDFIIIHLVGEGVIDENTFEFAAIAKWHSVSSYVILVAESNSHPYGKEELLQHFDDYIEPVVYEDNLEELLRKHIIIPKADTTPKGL